MASMRRTRSTSQMERGVPLSRVALRSRLVGACIETSCRWCASSASVIVRTSGFIEYSKWLRVQKISRPWKPAAAICSRCSGVNFRDTNRYVESSLCIIPSKIPRSLSIPRLRRHGADRLHPAGRRIYGNRVDESHVSDAMCDVAAGVQCTLQAVRKSALDQNAVGQPLVMETRSIDGRLRLHAEAHPVQDAKQRSGNNRGTARRAGNEAEVAISEQNRWRHGAERPVPGSDGIGFGLNQSEERIWHAWLRGEIVHLVIQEKASRGSGVRTVVIVKRVSAGDGVAGGIDDGKMSGVRTLAKADEGFWGGRVACIDAAGVGIAGSDDFAR